jgi:stage II sporulation protein D
MCQINPEIKNAVIQTSGLVIIDTAMQLITAAFHSNSGGHTANSEDVWLSNKHYLRARPDPYSLNQNNTSWSDTISKNFWINYLRNNGIVITGNNMDSILNFHQKNRNKYISINNDTLSLRKIREDLGLRSSWFSIHLMGDSLIFTGKGYGHGVGLSQEGAMQMARENFSFIDIIHYYYKNVKVIHYDLLVQ